MFKQSKLTRNWGGERNLTEELQKININKILFWI